jgi:hypothetical protein
MNRQLTQHQVPSRSLLKCPRKQRTALAPRRPRRTLRPQTVHSACAAAAVATPLDAELRAFAAAVDAAQSVAEAAWALFVEDAGASAPVLEPRPRSLQPSPLHGTRRPPSQSLRRTAKLQSQRKRPQSPSRPSKPPHRPLPAPRRRRGPACSRRPSLRLQPPNPPRRQPRLLKTPRTRPTRRLHTRSLRSQSFTPRKCPYLQLRTTW